MRDHAEFGVADPVSPCGEELERDDGGHRRELVIEFGGVRVKCFILGGPMNLCVEGPAEEGDYDDYDYDLNAKGVSTLSNSGVPKPETGSSVCFSAAPDVWTNAELRL